MKKARSKFFKRFFKAFVCVITCYAFICLVYAIYHHSTKGDHTLLDDIQNKSFSCVYNTVKEYPKSKQEGRAWRDGMIAGNGRLGFVTSGAPYDDTITFQNVDLIMPTTHDRDTIDDLYKDVEKTRQAIINFDDSFEAAGCGEWNYGYAFHPGHQLRISQEKHTFFSDYIRWTDFKTGEVCVSYSDKNGKWLRKTFTSRTDDATITSILSSQSGSKVNLTLSLDDLQGLYKFGYGDEVNMQYKKLVSDDCSSIALVAHYPDYEKSPLRYGGYVGVSYVITIGGSKEKIELPKSKRAGKYEEVDVSDSNPAIKIVDAEAVYIVSKLERTNDMGKLADFKNQTEFTFLNSLMDRCKQIEHKYAFFSYDEAIKQSAKEHSKLWNMSKIQFGGDEEDSTKPNEKLLSKQRHSRQINSALLQRLYNQAKFASVCSSGYTMTRLSGMWTGEWMPGWRSEYTMDANVNLQSSGMNSANLKNFAEGYIKFILRQVDDWKINAKQCYNMTDAIKAPVNYDGDGALDAEYAHSYPFQFWNAGASWMIWPIYEYYLCFGNQTIVNDDGKELDLLADILQPLLTLQSNFWAQLVSTEYYTDRYGNACYQKGKTQLADGEKYLIIPSYSPENTTGGEYNSTLAANASIDIAAAKSGLEMAVEVEKLTKKDGYKQRIALYDDLLNKLPEYQFDESGAIKEWCANQFQDNNKHRHISHLYLAWPMFETQNSRALYDAAIRAIDNRERENSASHGFVHQALVRARLKQSEEVYDIIHDLFDSYICYTSLMTDHNTNRGSDTYCTDTLLGLLGIVDEMLLYSQKGEIDFMPAVDKRLNQGEIEGLRARTQAEVSIKWNDGKVQASITSEIEQNIEISCAGTNRQKVHFDKGETKNFEFEF